MVVGNLGYNLCRTWAAITAASARLIHGSLLRFASQQQAVAVRVLCWLQEWAYV
jgi:hypothetical protein